MFRTVSRRAVQREGRTMDKTEQAAGPQSSAGDRRRQAMIEAAYELFMQKGYASVSVDDVIRVAGGSKSTLYKFFGNKAGLLRAVISALADDMLDRFDIEFHAARTPRESLLRIGGALADLALSANAIDQFRHAVAHARTFPDVSRLWFEAGPQRTIEGIAHFLEREHAAGRLHVEDPLRAAWFFGAMVIFRDNMALLVGLPPVTPSELHANVERAVDVFLAAYGT